MTYCLPNLYNDNLSQRSHNQYGEASLFSLDVGKCPFECLSNANHGSLHDYNDSFRKGIRTPPRGNDSNWRLISIFDFNYRYQAEHAASIVQAHSKAPQIMQFMKIELAVLEGIRSNHTSRRVGWNNLSLIRCMYAEVPIRVIGTFTSGLLDRFGVRYHVSHVYA